MADQVKETEVHRSDVVGNAGDFPRVQSAPCRRPDSVDWQILSRDVHDMKMHLNVLTDCANWRVLKSSLQHDGRA
jgi:hypothetical protein